MSALGVWLNDVRDAAGNVDQNLKEANQKEMESAIKLARENWNVRELIVGNEVMLRARMEYPDVAETEGGKLKLSPEAQLRFNDLVEYIRQAKTQSAKQVTTSEGWSEWVFIPDLVKEVDFITTHNLPFWEELGAKMRSIMPWKNMTCCGRPIPVSGS